MLSNQVTVKKESVWKNSSVLSNKAESETKQEMYNIPTIYLIYDSPAIFVSERNNWNWATAAQSVTKSVREISDSIFPSGKGMPDKK